MSEQVLIEEIVVEICVGEELGKPYEHIAKNILAIVKSNIEHLEYKPTTLKKEDNNVNQS